MAPVAGERTAYIVSVCQSSLNHLGAAWVAWVSYFEQLCLWLRLSLSETSRSYLQDLEQGQWNDIVDYSIKLPGVASPVLSSLPKMRSLALLYAASRSSRDNLQYQ